MDGTSRLAIEHSEVFWTAEYASAFVAIVSLIISLTDIGIVSSLSDITTCTVRRAWRRLTNQLSMSVTVEVVNHKLCVVGTSTDVFAQVDPPQ